MTLSFFESILKQVRPITSYIYLHVQGEPTLHPQFQKILSLCDAYSMKVQLVTNGTTLSSVKDSLFHHPSLRKINISLQSIEYHTLPLQQFESTLFSFIDAGIAQKKPIIELRFWRSDEFEEARTSTLLKDIQKTYSLEKTNRHHNYRIADTVYVDFDNMFEWPDASSKKNSTTGRCLGAVTQIAVLSDGTVVPCCLDCNGEIAFGNLHEQSLQQILNSERYQNMCNGFRHQKLTEPFCQKCTFRYRFNKS